MVEVRTGEVDEGLQMSRWLVRHQLLRAEKFHLHPSSNSGEEGFIQIHPNKEYFGGWRGSGDILKSWDQRQGTKGWGGGDINFISRL